MSEHSKQASDLIDFESAADSYRHEVQLLAKVTNLDELQAASKRLNEALGDVNAILLKQFPDVDWLFTDMASHRHSLTVCKRCGTNLNDDRCQDETCPFSDCSQESPKGWVGHPEENFCSQE